MPDRPRPVAAGPPVEAHALPLPVVAVPVPGTLRVELRPSRDLRDLEGYRTVRRGGGHGEEREISELCLEEDGRGVAAGGVAEHGGGVGIAVVVPCHGYLGGGGRARNDNNSRQTHFLLRFCFIV